MRRRWRMWSCRRKELKMSSDECRELAVIGAEQTKPDKTGHLDRKQVQAVAALLSQPTILAAAETVGVNEVTIRRWLKDAGFAEAYREACRQVVDSAMGTLQAACVEAVNTLRNVMGDADAPASSRVTAARAVLDSALKARELQDVEERIAALEEAAETWESPPEKPV